LRCGVSALIAKIQKVPDNEKLENLKDLTIEPTADGRLSLPIDDHGRLSIS